MNFSKIRPRREAVVPCVSSSSSSYGNSCHGSSGGGGAGAGAGTGTGGGSCGSSSNSTNSTNTNSATEKSSMTRTKNRRTGSCVVNYLERSVLRTLEFVLNQIDRKQARYCANSIAHVYMHLHTQLPLFVADSLENVAESFISHSDEEFVDFWRSLIDTKDMEATKSFQQEQQQQEATVVEQSTLVARLYHGIAGQVQRIFTRPIDMVWHTRTPPASPDDQEYEYRASSCYTAATRRRIKSSEQNEYQDEEANQAEEEDDEYSEKMEEQKEEDDTFEPGWAVEYMEQESRVPSEVTRRMRMMMHSDIPLNLFRVAVIYDTDGLEDLMGSVSPESFPPTPITRDLQTKKMTHYTNNVLDHATLALRLLQNS